MIPAIVFATLGAAVLLFMWCGARENDYGAHDG